MENAHFVEEEIFRFDLKTGSGTKSLTLALAIKEDAGCQYHNLRIEPAMCSCFGKCEVSHVYAIFGKRPETAKEHDARMAISPEDAEERALYERLREKYDSVSTQARKETADAVKLLPILNKKIADLPFYTRFKTVMAEMGIVYLGEVFTCEELANDPFNRSVLFRLIYLPSVGKKMISNFIEYVRENGLIDEYDNLHPALMKWKPPTK